MKSTRTVNVEERKILRNGVVIYTIKGSTGNHYFATYANGKAECICRGFSEWGHCYHADYISREEALRSAVDQIVAAAEANFHFEQMGERYLKQQAEKQESQATRGLCGHLWRREDEMCGQCNGGW